MRARYNPDGSPTRELQLVLLEILEELDRICTDNGIEYWLDSGTCLGAVRHGGFIPWDDDVDVCMTKPNYDRFIEVFREDDRFALTTRENDLYYTYGYAKMRLKNMVLSENGTTADIHYRHRGPFIDIFIVDKVPVLSARIFKQVACHLHIFTKIKHPGIISVTLLRFFKALYLGVLKMWAPVARRLPWAQYRFALGISFYKHVFPEGMFDKLIRVPFETMMAPIPQQYDKLLTIYYGDYMKLPDEKDFMESKHYIRG